jgi:hypothetical protein
VVSRAGLTRSCAAGELGAFEEVSAGIAFMISFVRGVS